MSRPLKLVLQVLERDADRQASHNHSAARIAEENLQRHILVESRLVQLFLGTPRFITCREADLAVLPLSFREERSHLAKLLKQLSKLLLLFG